VLRAPLLGSADAVLLLDQAPHDLAALDVLSDAAARTRLGTLQESPHGAHDADPT
jgi:hypothetical protein